MMSRATLACVLILGIASAATAQTPPSPPPSPPPAQKPLEPDRPDVTNGTHIVGAGLLQIEFGGLYARVTAGQRNIGSPFTARVGVTEWFEARIGMDGLLSQVDAGSRATGFGNVQLGAKLRLWGDPGGIPVLSILPTVNLPTASVEKGLGSGDADYTVVLLTGTDFLKRAHIDVNYGIGAIGAGGGRPHFVQHLVSASASVSAGERWDPYAEVFWFSRQDAEGGAMTAVDLGAIYTVSTRLAFDGGAQFGLSRAAPNLAVFGGVSLVVGDVLGQHGVHARHRTAEKHARPHS
jgi:hypothetical protein